MQEASALVVKSATNRKIKRITQHFVEAVRMDRSLGAGVPHPFG